MRSGVIAGALLVPAACGDDGGDGASSPPTVEGTTASVALPAPPDTPDGPSGDPGVLQLPAGVEVFVEFPRYLQAARRLEVAFDNQSTSVLTITDLGLRSPLFEPAADETGRTEIEAGRRRDLPIGLGAPVCPAPAGPAIVEATVEIDGVSRRGAVVVEPDPLQRISAQECGSRLVLEHLDVGYGRALTVTDGAVETTIDIVRTDGDEPVVVPAVRGSVLIELQPVAASTPLAVIPSDGAGTSIPVRLRVTRCDPHAVTESKKTFELAIWVALGDRQPQRLVIAPEGALRTTLEQLIDECLREHTG